MNKILLTGDPGCGKTTLTKKVVKELCNTNLKVDGFYTEELREQGQRIGFDVILIRNGTRGPLARISKNPNTPGPKVGKYTVDLKSFESLVLPILSPDNINSCHVIVLDEIGKMELFSTTFGSMIKQLFQQIPKIILATVPTRGSYLVENLKKQSQSKENLYTVNSLNRNQLVDELKMKILNSK